MDGTKYVLDDIVEHFSPIGDVWVTRERDPITVTFSLCPNTPIEFSIPLHFNRGQFNLAYWMLITFSGQMTPIALKKLFFSLQKFPVSFKVLTNAFKGFLEGPSDEHSGKISKLLTSLRSYKVILASFIQNGLASTQVTKNTISAMKRKREELHYYQVDQYERDMKYFTLLDGIEENVQICRDMRNDLLLPLIPRRPLFNNDTEFSNVEKRLCYYLEHRDPSFRNVLTRLFFEEGFFIYQFICHFELLPEVCNQIIWLFMLLHVFLSEK